MREAFGVQARVRYSGVYRSAGLQIAPQAQELAPISPERLPGDANAG